MSITCQICNTVFEKIIPWQHLKTHQITTTEYKEKHGALYSSDTIAKLAKRIPHNKGTKITDPDKLVLHNQAIQKREEKYRQGVLVRASRAKTLQEKQVLSQKSKDYALANPDKMAARSQKAILTKIANGYDFGQPMRGRTHTDLTKQKIKNKLANTVQQKTRGAHANIIEKLTELNLSLQNSLTETSLSLKCNHCQTEFSFTKQYFTPSKFKTSLCPTCNPRVTNTSAGERALFEFVKLLCPDAIAGWREHYHKQELDIFIPSMQLGIEFNGLYWHSESVFTANGKDPKSDSKKHAAFAANGIRVIGIFEDEWENQQHIVKSRLTNILGKTKRTIFARKCIIKEVSSTDATQFCNLTHIMGKGRSNRRLGLYYNNQLVSLMTFTKSNLSRKLVNTWEINRFSSLLDVSIIGGASRLFAAFLKIENPTKIISYADNRWSTGNLYNQLGFKLINNGVPNYWYLKANLVKRIHRFTLRKNQNDNQLLTELENRQQQGYNRVWDCGSAKWEWTQK